MSASTREPWWRRWFGNRAESHAARFLEQLGYRILTRNYRCKLGELDLIALDGACVVFVEVRSTKGEDALQPARSVAQAKQRKLTRLAQHYVQCHRLQDCALRFDVIAIQWPERSATPLVEHYIDAFAARES